MSEPAEKCTICANGSRIVELRRKRGWSQQDLADAAGLQDKRTVSNAERGKPVYLQTIRTIATALEVAVAALLPDVPEEVVQKGLDVLRSAPVASVGGRLASSTDNVPLSSSGVQGRRNT